MSQPFRINLGGEGEVPGIINQQGPWILDTSWRSSLHGWTLPQLLSLGHSFLIAPNTSLPLPDGIVDEVITNSVPIDRVTYLGPGVQSVEIKRILRSGGRWINNGLVIWVQP